MLLPDKHLRISESILGLAALVLSRLKKPIAFDKLMTRLAKEFDTPSWPARHSAESVSLALCLLYSIGKIDVATDGTIVRCASSNSRQTTLPFIE